MMSGPAVPGKFVVSDHDGGYTTELPQTGTVSAITTGTIPDADPQTNCGPGLMSGCMGGPNMGQPMDGEQCRSSS
ncbi:hypothetical protein [Nocardia sp. NPDC004604]|uniref:hypothetical protein n=1 Tax=Nocardia sp. NPDC004604 TaxID=3157013 RepID=UPI00339F522A